jgi:RNA polymerase sigma factor (sigma-70 family)
MAVGQPQLERFREDPSDRVLLERLRRGQSTAATELYGRYATRLLALAKARCTARAHRSCDPEDVVQSVFRRFFRRLQVADYDVPEGKDLWRLFVVIALNKIRSSYAADCAHKRRQPHANDLVRERCVNHRTHRAFLRLTMQESLSCLPAKHQAVVGLRMAGHSVADIAAQVRRSQRTVERWLQESRALLRGLYEENP